MPSIEVRPRSVRTCAARVDLALADSAAARKYAADATLPGQTSIFPFMAQSVAQRLRTTT
jgi:hypothetical protein